jgi:hypothetical protein
MRSEVGGGITGEGDCSNRGGVRGGEGEGYWVITYRVADMDIYCSKIAMGGTCNRLNLRDGEEHYRVINATGEEEEEGKGDGEWFNNG